MKVRDPDVCAVVPDEGLHPRPRRASRLRARPVPAAEGRQPRLHVLPRLRPRLPARQHRHPRRRPGPRPLERCRPLRHRPARRPAGPCGAGPRPGLRRVRQRRRDGRTGPDVAATAWRPARPSFPAGDHHGLLSRRPGCAALGGSRPRGDRGRTMGPDESMGVGDAVLLRAGPDRFLRCGWHTTAITC